MDEQQCIVHYAGIRTECRLTDASPETFKSLLECKAIRKELGGANLHSEQCDAIPDVFSNNFKYHLACYKKFTLARSLIRKKKADSCADSEVLRKSSRYSFSPEPVESSACLSRRKECERREMFPEYCMICNKYSIKVAGQKQLPVTIVTDTAEDSMKRAAELKNDFEMLGTIKDRSLIAQEFKRHMSCHRDYTRVLTKSHIYAEKGQKSRTYEQGDFNSVCDLIESQIIAQQRCISMSNLISVYGIGTESVEQTKKYRHKLKCRLQEKYGDQIIFITPHPQSVQVVISRESLTSNPISSTLPTKNEEVIQLAARILRENVLDHIQKALELPWPPSVESLKSPDRQNPELLESFYKTLLTPSDTHKCLSDRKLRLVGSFCSDLIFAVSNGKHLTLKHTALGLGLHSMTGQASHITLLNRLGHSISINQVNLIETGQAELAQFLQQTSVDLPLIPASMDSRVQTIFWWDNFDKNVATISGGASIHNTPGIAFQEQGTGSVWNERKIDIPQSKRRSIQLLPGESTAWYAVDPKTNPGLFVTNTVYISGREQEYSKKLLLIWQIVRAVASQNQIHSRLAGFVIKLFQMRDTPPTAITYLPPIQRPITEYGTMFEVFYNSRKLAQQSHMKYTHITMDVGAAIKAYHVIWNNPLLWWDIIIHLGDFHAFCAFFGTIGTYIAGSGFEEVIFQADLCTSGSITGLLAGKEYNRCWVVHEAFAEAIERMFIKQYVTIDDNDIAGLASDCFQFSPEFVKNYMMSSETFLNHVEEQKKKALEGEFGETAQYWMLYAKFVNQLHKLHFAININDFDLRLSIWIDALAMCFATNRVHYSRYGTYYVNQLKRIEELYPGAKAEVEKAGLSVRRNSRGIGQAVDLAGEQTFMKSAKTVGGITRFATSPETVAKWVLNRPFQSKFTEALKDLADINESVPSSVKSLRPAQISKSEVMVCSIIEILECHFLSPFDPSLDKDKLYNIVSGSPLDNDISESLLRLEQTGIKLRAEFEDRLVQSSDATLTFFDSIKKNKFRGFEDAFVKTTIKKSGKEKEISCQRDMLGFLVYQSDKKNRPVNMQTALSFPLAPISLPLCHADGAIRKTNKSSLCTAAMSDLVEISCRDLPRSSELFTYFIDVMAVIRSLPRKACNTVRDIAKNIVTNIPRQYSTVYLVCDTYKEGSIKQGERDSRGKGKRIILKTPDMKVPADLLEFLKNGDNKSMLLDLLEKAIIQEKGNLGNRIVFFSNEYHCSKIASESSDMIAHLSSDHEEADTKIVALLHAANIPQGKSVMIRSHSADTDIMVLLLLHPVDGVRVLLDNGTGTSRRVIDINSSTLHNEERGALSGIHAVSGNDYISSFFRKGKKAFWKSLLKNPAFMECFEELGSLTTLNDTTEKRIEQFICLLYGFPKESSVNNVRYLLYKRMSEKKQKAVDLTVIPPCLDNLKLHLLRSNYIAHIYAHANNLKLLLESPTQHGWDDNRFPIWSKTVFPEDVAELLLESDVENDESTLELENDCDIEEALELEEEEETEEE